MLFIIAVIYVAMGVVAAVLIIITITIVLCVLKMRKQSNRNKSTVTGGISTSGSAGDKGSHFVNEAFSGEYEQTGPRVARADVNYTAISPPPRESVYYEDIPLDDQYEEIPDGQVTGTDRSNGQSKPIRDRHPRKSLPGIDRHPGESFDGYIQPVTTRPGHQDHRDGGATVNPDDIPSDYLTNPEMPDPTETQLPQHGNSTPMYLELLPDD